MKYFIFALTFCALAACKPASESFLQSEDSGTAKTMDFTITRNTTVEISAPTGSRMVDLERMQLAREATAKPTTNNLQKLRYVALSPANPLLFRFSAKVTGNQTCTNSTAGSALNGAVAVQCSDASSQIKALQDACLALEKEDATIATYPGAADYCTCTKQAGQKIFYKDFLGYPALFKHVCKVGGATHQGLCKIITDQFCPTGKECFAGGQTCQCDSALLTYSDVRYQDNLPRFRDDCMAALGVGADVNATSVKASCEKLSGLYECPSTMICGAAATICQCGDVKLNFADFGSASATAFRDRCEAGFATAHRDALVAACEELEREGTATGVDKESCACINETLYFKDYIGTPGAVAQLKYDCFGD